MNRNLSGTLQEFHNLTHKALEDRERVRYLGALKGCSIVEQYRNGELSLVLDLMCRWDVDSIRRGGVDAPRVAGNFLRLIFHSDSGNSSALDDGEQKPMLINDIQFVKGPKESIASLVRLDFGDHQPEQIRTEHVYFSVFEHAFKVLSIVNDREFKVLSVSAGRNARECLRPDEIERRPEVVDTVSSNEGQIIPDAFQIRDIVLNSISTALTVCLHAHGVEIWQVRQDFFKVVEVFIGPIKL